MNKLRLHIILRINQRVSFRINFAFVRCMHKYFSAGVSRIFDVVTFTTIIIRLKLKVLFLEKRWANLSFVFLFSRFLWRWEFQWNIFMPPHFRAYTTYYSAFLCPGFISAGPGYGISPHQAAVSLCVSPLHTQEKKLWRGCQILQGKVRRCNGTK